MFPAASQSWSDKGPRTLVLGAVAFVAAGVVALLLHLASKNADRSKANRPPGAKEPQKGMFRWVLGVFVLLFVIFASVVGWLEYDRNQQKLSARNVVREEKPIEVSARQLFQEFQEDEPEKPTTPTKVKLCR